MAECRITTKQMKNVDHLLEIAEAFANMDRMGVVLGQVKSTGKVICVFIPPPYATEIQKIIERAKEDEAVFR